jgi:hypothetical protein
VTEAMYFVPICNIWDSISLIYTLCVEPIYSAKEAEHHLYQFRTIVQCLSNHWYFKPDLGPTTVVYTARDNGRSQRQTIAFAINCCGDLARKHAMAQIRVNYAGRLTEAVLRIQREVNVIRANHRVGNCAEWFSFVIVCRSPGAYDTLCYSLLRDFMYQMCEYCSQFGELLWKSRQIMLRDRIAEASLGMGSVTQAQSFMRGNIKQWATRALKNNDEYGRDYLPELRV